MRKYIIVGMLIISVMTFLGCKVNLKSPGVVDELYYEEIYTFNFEHYESYYSQSYVKGMKQYGRIDSAGQAARIAEEIFLLGFDEKKVYEFKPFSISYDARNTVWLVDSSCYVLDQKYGEQWGRGASVILDEETGEVLDAWGND